MKPWLLFLGVLALGLVQTFGESFVAPLTAGLSRNITYVNASADVVASGHSVTNASRAPSGSTIFVGPGHYHIPTNQFSLSKHLVNWFFYPGAKLTSGTAADGDAHYLFGDFDLGNGWEGPPLTNSILGYGEFIHTNISGLGPLFWQATNSSVVFECNSTWQVGGSSAIQHERGDLVYSARDFTRAETYDAYLGGGSNVSTIHFTSARVYGGDSILEPGLYADWGDAVFNIGYAEALAGAGGNGALHITDFCTMRIGVINLKRSAAVIGGTSTNRNQIGNGVLQGCTIYALPASTLPVVASPGATFGTSLTLQNCTIYGPTARDPIDIETFVGGRFTIENSTVVPGSGATNWIRATGTGKNATIRNVSVLPAKPPHAGVITTNHFQVNSPGIVTASYTTNTYLLLLTDEIVLNGAKPAAGLATTNTLPPAAQMIGRSVRIVDNSKTAAGSNIWVNTTALAETFGLGGPTQTNISVNNGALTFTSDGTRYVITGAWP